MRHSSRAYIVLKEKLLYYNQGVGGDLSFDDNVFTFNSPENSFGFKTSEIQKVDLNNILAKSQVVFFLNNSQKYIFTFFEPVSTIESLKMTFFKNRVNANVDLFTKMANSHDISMSWKKVISDNLPANKVMTRTEIRPLRTVLIGVSLAMFLLILLALVLFIVYKL